MASKKASSHQLARRRGASFEERVKRILNPLGSYIYNGQAGDVVAGPYIVECKYRTGLKPLDNPELASWIDQAKRNAAFWEEAGEPKQWLLVFTGGGRSGAYVVVDHKETPNPPEGVPRFLIEDARDDWGIYHVFEIHDFLRLHLEEGE